jgi:CRP/FNR family transcriptional regulator, anaerobic regulatory protein
MHSALAFAATAAAAPQGAMVALAGMPLPAMADVPLFGPSLVRCRHLRARQALYHAGQPRGALYLVESGCFKTCLLAGDGREKITGFRFAGDFLGLDALGSARNPCGVVCIAEGTVRELGPAQMSEQPGELGSRIVLALARELLHSWQWMLTLSSLCADRRVAAFLLELDGRYGGAARGDAVLSLPMTRADVGNYLALQLETVVRALSRLEARGLVRNSRRRIELLDRAGLSHFARQDAAPVH